jgi:hypothetical protein
MSDLDELLDAAIAKARMIYTESMRPDIEATNRELREAVKEAFKEAGWEESSSLESRLLGCKVILRRPLQLRPEWMVKNGIDYNMITDVSLLPPREEYEAAKRASVLEEE